MIKAVLISIIGLTILIPAGLIYLLVCLTFGSLAYIGEVIE